MEIHAALASDRGQHREGNEDFGLSDPGLGLFVVCDGMGGHQAGEIASRTAAEAVRSVILDASAQLAAFDAGRLGLDALVALVRRAVETASRTVYQLSSNDLSKRGMGTTCTAMLFRGTKAVMAHVGDSRLYMMRDARVYQLSEDHTFAAEAVRRGVLPPDQAEASSHAHIITRAVGTQPGVQVDTLILEVLPGDVYLLCSDGLHQYMTDELELQRCLAEEPFADLAAKFVKLANTRGGEDNITAIVIRARAPRELAEAETQRARRVTANLDALGKIEIFRDLSMADIVRVSSAFAQREHPEGFEVIQEGEVSASLWVIVRGSASVYRKGELVAELPAGSHFGEMALLNQRPRSASIRLREPSRLLVLEREGFFGLLREDAVLAAGILWRLAQTLSMRLDDFYLLQEGTRTTSEDLGRETLAYGLFPSPFDRRGPQS